VSRIVDTGRVEVKGASLRFKQKGTLEAFDRNAADLLRVYVRVTPSPDLKLFADFVFPEEIFRVWQESALINYKDFLEKVELVGIDNFRGFLRHVTRALPDSGIDTSSRDFAHKGLPPERFVSKDELADYDKAILAGLAPHAAEANAGAGASATPAARAEAAALSEAQKREAAERAWKQFAPEIAAERAARKEQPPIAAAALTFLGGMLVLASLVAFTRQREIAHDSQINLLPMIAIGGVAGLGLLIAGLLYLRPRDRG